jgi:hypothetical protein
MRQREILIHHLNPDSPKSIAPGAAFSAARRDGKLDATGLRRI